MSRWKQLAKMPEGALPGGIVTKAGVVLIAVLVAGLLFSWSVGGPADDGAGTAAPPEPRPVDDRAGRAFEGQIRADTERQAQQAAADEARDRENRRRAAAGADTTPFEPREPSPGGAPGMGQAEWELREALRLEEIERGTRSLRSPPVTQSYRDAGEARGGARAAQVEPESPDAALDAALSSFERSVAALEAEMAAGLAGQPLPSSGVDPPTAHRAPGTAEPGRIVGPEDHPGWERIREGSFLEAVLLTQLSGEFPGPVLAMVSVPLYSADRQRVLIPRGARVVGTAQPVQNRDQSRLAVAFHRLLLPDGRWIDLEFAGLGQAGDGALRDQVNRHYLGTFAAAGAIGALSGLALAGGSPYGLRAGVGQGLAGSATTTLDRFLNRMPEITIRPGHRLRIWFTADVLVPNSTTLR